MPVASDTSADLTIEELGAWVVLKNRIYADLTPEERTLWDRIHRRRMAKKLRDVVCDGNGEVACDGH